MDHFRVRWPVSSFEPASFRLVAAEPLGPHAAQDAALQVLPAASGQVGHPFFGRPGRWIGPLDLSMLWKEQGIQPTKPKGAVVKALSLVLQGLRFALCLAYPT